MTSKQEIERIAHCIAKLLAPLTPLERMRVLIALPVCSECGIDTEGGTCADCVAADAERVRLCDEALENGSNPNG